MVTKPFDAHLSFVGTQFPPVIIYGGLVFEPHRHDLLCGTSTNSLLVNVVRNFESPIGRPHIIDRDDIVGRLIFIVILVLAVECFEFCPSLRANFDSQKKLLPNARTRDEVRHL